MSDYRGCQHFSNRILMLFLCILYIGMLKSQTKISVLSWNVKLLPKITQLAVKKPKDINDKLRLDSIICKIKENNADVVMLQEAFDPVFNKIILNTLKEIYPYNITPTAQFMKFSNGLLCLSKRPINKHKTIFFKKSTWSDYLVSKGAVSFSCDMNGQTIYMINTHLQSDYDIVTSEKIRKHQLAQIQNELLSDKNIEQSLTILAGDFNFNESSKEYLQTQNLFEWSDVSLNKNMNMNTFSSDNYWNKELKKSEKLDYFFCNNLQHSITDLKCSMKSDFKIKDVDLSDHFPLILNFTITRAYSSAE